MAEIAYARCGGNGNFGRMRKKPICLMGFFDAFFVIANEVKQSLRGKKIATFDSLQ